MSTPYYKVKKREVINMLWFLDYEITKWFLGLCLATSLLSAVLLSFAPVRAWLKAILILLLFSQVYLVFIITDNMLGKPKPNNFYGVDGIIKGYTVFTKSEEKRIAIFISLKRDERPITISIPWTKEEEQKLKEAAEKESNYGIPTGIKSDKKPDRKGLNMPEPTLELYEFEDSLKFDHLKDPIQQ